MRLIIEIDAGREYCEDCVFAFPRMRNPSRQYTCHNKALPDHWGNILDKDSPGNPKRTQDCLIAEYD